MKNKKIIILQGIAGCGKTETLKLLIKILEEDFEFIEVDKMDFDECVCEKNKRIGICTRGDSETELDEWVNKIQDCEVIVCPCRSRGATYHFFEELKENNTVYYHTKWGIWLFENDCRVVCKDLYNISNEAQAKALAELIKMII